MNTTMKIVLLPVTPVGVVRQTSFFRHLAFRMVTTLSLVLTTAMGCAGANEYVNTYRAGVITREVVTTSHKELWSDPLRVRAEECDAKVPEDGTDVELDLCLKPFTQENNDKVVQALAAYQTAAATLSAILIAAESNPKGLDKAALKTAVLDAVDAARTLIALFPEAQAWLDRLEMLVKGLL
jgi:hypothetical protein